MREPLCSTKVHLQVILTFLELGDLLLLKGNDSGTQLHITDYWCSWTSN